LRNVRLADLVFGAEAPFEERPGSTIGAVDVLHVMLAEPLHQPSGSTVGYVGINTQQAKDRPAVYRNCVTLPGSA
jgi:hypothetical protein